MNGDQCCICAQSFSIRLKRFVCADCSQAMCKYDRYTKNESFVCERCKRSDLEMSVKEEMHGEMSKVSESVRKLKEVKEQYKEEIRLKQESTDRYTNTMKNNQEIHLQKMQDIDSRANQEKKRKDQLGELNKSLTPVIEQSTASLTQNKNRLKELQKEIEKETETQTSLTREENTLLEDLNQIQLKTKGMIGAVKLRQTLCKVCYHKCKLEFQDTLRQALSNDDRQSLVESVLRVRKSRQVSSKPDPLSNNACKNCLIF